MTNGVLFGFFPEPAADDLPTLVRRVQDAERLGFDLVGVQDHPYQARYADTWTLLAHLGAVTNRIRLFTDVANLPLRPPAVLAKAAATLDLLTGGRFELGLGAGAFWDAIAAMGGPRRTPGEALAALAEAIDVIRAMWSDERSIDVDGSIYRVRGVHPGPRPAHDIGMWIGGYGPRMLRLIGRRADGWLPSLPFLPPEHLGAAQARIDAAAAAAGRDPSSILRIYNVTVTVGGDPAEGWLSGPPELIRDRLTHLVVDSRMDGFVLWPSGDIDEQLRRFAEEVIPAVRGAARLSRRQVHETAVVPLEGDRDGRGRTVAVLGDDEVGLPRTW